MHYAFDIWMEINYPSISFVRYADDIIVHCDRQEDASRILDSIQKRMEECKLELHLEKTKIVYCKDYRRKGKSEYQKFDFLGFSFKPRPTRSKRDGKTFLGFGPAISKSSGKAIVAELKELGIHRLSILTIEDIARILNPKIRGWINYFGKFRRSSLQIIFYKLQERLMKWAINKYKSLNRIKTNGYNLLKKFYKKNPTLFYHWKVGFTNN